VAAAALQVAVYVWVLRPSLQSGDPARLRPGMVRWLRLDVPIQAAILAGAGIYIAVQTANHVRGVGLMGPPAGAVLGSALPLQVVAMSMMRAIRP
jgi:hypothetical protein